MSFEPIVNQQRHYFRTGVTKPVAFRIEQLKKLKAIIKDNESLILEALHKDLNKSSYEAFITEVGTIYEEIDKFIKKLNKWARPKSVSTPLHLKPGYGKIFNEAYGVVCVFAPWNYPFQLLMSPALGSIAAGNCSILKPADLTSHTQKLIIKIVNENFEPGYLHAIGGGVPECEELLNERFDYIFFTGSPRVGRIVMTAAAKNLTPVCLELGGKSPCIVDKEVDLKTAAKRICWAKFLNAGQTCVAPDYVYVHKDIKKEFLETCVKFIEEFFGESPEKNDNYGRIITENHYKRILDLIKKDQVFYGGSSNVKNSFIAPTILENVTWQDEVMKEEIFGPIMPVLEFSSIEDVCSEINLRPKPLALYIFSKSKKVQEYIIENTSSGGGCVNDCIIHLGNPNLPFGGVGESGMGAYHGFKSFETLSHQKGFHFSSTFFDNPLRYPPYTNLKKKLVKKFFN